MCHHRTSEYVHTHEDAEEREALPEWAIEAETDADADEQPEPFAPAEAD